MLVAFVDVFDQNIACLDVQLGIFIEDLLFTSFADAFVLFRACTASFAYAVSYLLASPALLGG